MSSQQRNSIAPLTHTQFPNLYIDKLMAFLTPYEFVVLVYAARRTLGFHKRQDYISLTQFQDGIGIANDDGELVEYGTGLTRPTITKALTALVGFGVLQKTAVPRGDKRGTIYALELDESAIDFESIYDRKIPTSKRGLPVVVKPVYQSDDSTSKGGLPVVVKPVYQFIRKKEERKKERKESDNGVSEGQTLMWNKVLALSEGEKEVAADLWKLGTYFSEVTEIKRPDIESENGRDEMATDWYKHLLVIYKTAGGLDMAQKVVASTVEQMDNATPSLTIVAPKSVVRMANGAIAKSKRDTSAGGASMVQLYQVDSMTEFGA